MKFESELRFLELLRKPIKSKEEMEEEERARVLFVGELHQEIRELSEELKDAGTKYTDPWDLVNTPESYPEAIDILIKHLPRQYHKRNKEGIVRALTVKEAKGKANDALIAEYNRVSKENDSLRWAIGNAIWFIVTKNDLKSIFKIVENKENGESRSRFIQALGKIKSEESEAVLIKLLNDKEVAVYALQSLGKLKSKKAREKVYMLTNDSNVLIKKEAQKALKKIG
jgi:HEAT repeat protein